jgi:Threonine/Serine exporter, ThrE
MGLLSWASYASMIYIGSTEVPANTLGAFVAALASTSLIRRSTIPAFGLVSAALLPLVPGLSLYNGLLQVVGTSPETAKPSEGWVNSVGRSLCRFGHSSWRNPRDLPRTPDRRLASRYPNAAPSTATQRAAERLWRCAWLRTLARSQGRRPAIGQ